MTVTVICHIKCDPMNFVMEPQQKGTRRVPPTVQLQPTLIATKDSFLWGAFLTLGPKKPRMSLKFYLRRIRKCEMQTYNNCLEVRPIHSKPYRRVTAPKQGIFPQGT